MHARAICTSVLVVLALIGGTVGAQPADVPALIKLIENQPSDMDRSAWKEKRRDAARKLAQTKDKRGTPVLMRLAETETFDIIGEIAIEGLGTMGDPSAVPTLQAIVADPSRDKTSRDLARKALARLGAPEVGKPAGTGTTTTTTTTTGTGGTKPGTGGTKPGTGTTTGGGTTTAGGTTTTTTTTTTGGATTTGGGTTTVSGSGTAKPTGGGSGRPNVATGGGGGEGSEGGGAGGGLDPNAGGGLLGEKQGTTVEGMPELDDDVIAASERLTLALGTVGLRMQAMPEDAMGNRNKRVDFDADIAALYQKRLDTESKAYAINAEAQIVAGYINPEGAGVTRGLLFDVHGDGEARFYSNQLYGIGKAALSVATQYIKNVDPDNPGNDVAETQTQADLQIALGGGFGRIVDVGAAIRVRRLGRMLDESRALGKPIDAATAKRLQLTWWALRGERSQFRSLIATIAVLREAGILLGEPNAVIVYEILTVLRDTQLYVRPQGFDVQLVVAEGYLKRPENDAGACVVTCGRIEQVIAQLGYATQVDDDKLEVSASGFARYRLFAPDDGTYTPWAAGAGARMRRFTYGEHGDPFGAVDLAGNVRVSTDGDPDGSSDKQLRLEGQLGFTYWVNQASGIRLAAVAAEDAGAFYLGARLEATYGLLDGIFAR